MASVSGGVVGDAALLLWCGAEKWWWRLWRAGEKNPKHLACAFRGMGLGELGNSRAGFIRGLGGLVPWWGRRRARGTGIGGHKQVAGSRGPGWESEWGFLSGDGRGSDGRRRECAAADEQVRAPSAGETVPACRVGGWVQTLPGGRCRAGALDSGRGRDLFWNRQTNGVLFVSVLAC